MCLVDCYPYTVDRAKLRQAISCGHVRGPKHMLKKVIHLVFDIEELANSCGQGLGSGSEVIENGEKMPLEKDKVAACRGILFSLFLNLG